MVKHILRNSFGIPMVGLVLDIERREVPCTNLTVLPMDICEGASGASAEASGCWSQNTVSLIF